MTGCREETERSSLRCCRCARCDRYLARDLTGNWSSEGNSRCRRIRSGRSDRGIHVTLDLSCGQRPVVNPHFVDEPGEVLSHIVLPPIMRAPVLVAIEPVTARVVTWAPFTKMRSVVPS